MLGVGLLGGATARRERRTADTSNPVKITTTTTKTTKNIFLPIFIFYIFMSIVSYHQTRMRQHRGVCQDFGVFADQKLNILPCH